MAAVVASMAAGHKRDRILISVRQRHQHIEPSLSGIHQAVNETIRVMTGFTVAIVHQTMSEDPKRIVMANAMLRHYAVPVRMFATEAEARRWLSEQP